MDEAQISRVRSFDRLVAQSVGALDDHFLGRARPMGEARVLWEVGDGVDVRELRGRLGLDAGYLSRLLGSLRRQGLIESSTDSGDHRVRRVVLTDTGRAERAELDRRSDSLAEAWLSPLDVDERARLVAAMGEVERLILRSQATIGSVPATDPDVRRCFGRYVAELQDRFPQGFDVQRSNHLDVAGLVPPNGLVLLARIGNDAVGCGAIMFLADDVAELKRVWVAPRVRGMGLGRRMLRELERHAASGGASTVRLETNHSLTEAIALYRAEGYAEVPAFNDEPYAHHWFEKRSS
jgi:DNA-binding MarR family transcriptional regulator/GNAT superfamily N-acetyltransferase